MTEVAPRSTAVDQTRIAASAAVVLTHAAGAAVTTAEVGPGWWAANVYDAASHWSVPVFFLLSGHLLLAPGRDEPATVFFRKRLSRLLVPLVAWTAFYGAWFAVRRTLKGDAPAVEEVAWRVVGGRASYHLWFLYAIVPMYLVTPALRSLHRSLDPRVGVALWATLLGLAAAAFAWLRPAQVTVGPVAVWWIPYLPYFALAPFLGRLPTDRYRGLAWAVAVTGTAATAAGCGWYATAGRLDAGLLFYSYLSPTVIATSLAVFHLTRGWSRPALPDRWILELSACSLGIFLVHPLLIEGMRYVGLRTEVGPAWSVPAVAVVTFLASFGLVHGLRRVPGLDRLV